MTYGIPREMVKYLADHHNITTREARKSVEITLGAITEFLEKGKLVKLKKFGTFELSKWAEREYTCPRTGDRIKSKATIRPRFNASKEMREVIKNSKLVA